MLFSLHLDTFRRIRSDDRYVLTVSMHPKSHQKFFIKITNMFRSSLVRGVQAVKANFQGVPSIFQSAIIPRRNIISRSIFLSVGVESNVSIKSYVGLANVGIANAGIESNAGKFIINPMSNNNIINPMNNNNSILNKINVSLDKVEDVLQADSVLRKRRLKMKKHKLRKRRREQRSLMKRLGKI